MPRFTYIYLAHRDSSLGLKRLIKMVRTILFALIIAWMPPLILYETLCKLGEAGVETELIQRALNAEKRIALKRRTDEYVVNRILHEFEEMAEFYRQVR